MQHNHSHFGGRLVQSASDWVIQEIDNFFSGEDFYQHLLRNKQ